MTGCAAAGDLRQMRTVPMMRSCVADSFNLLSEEEVRHFFAQCQKRLGK
ncbi:MAG: hypothetical protein ACLVJ6_06170 [Merdibacter sp.]